MNIETQRSAGSKLQQPAQVGTAALDRLSTNAQDAMAIAMKLTDSWGQAMFVMDGAYVEKLFSTLGFEPAVAARVYEKTRALAYVNHKQRGQADQPEFTWHITDAACLTLRGAVGLGRSMASVTDKNVENLLVENKDLFETLMSVMPDYTQRLMFSPEVAATVMSTLGANVSADTIYDLAWRYGGQVTKDLDGRRGVSTQFIRSLTLTIAARLEG